MTDKNQPTASEQLQAGFANLRFRGALEKRFRRYYSKRYLLRLRFAALVAAAIFAFFGAYNYFELPQPFGSFAAAVQLLYICPLLMLLWWLAGIPRLSRHTVAIFLTGLIGATSGLLLIIISAHFQDVRYRYDGLMLVTMYIYFMSGVRLRLALASGFGVMTAYLVGEAFSPLPARELIENAFYLLSTNLIGAMGCYGLEHALRKSYLTTLLLEEQAQRDGLTGIANRRYMEAQVGRLWRQAQRDQKRVAVAFFDLDRFKSYNDTHGHLAGDECLVRVAQTLNRHARRPLDIAARYGGEEFIILWYDADPPEHLIVLADLARRAIEELAIEHLGDSTSGRVTTSVGVSATTPNEACSIEELMHAADSALYEAKAKGGNCAVVYPHMQPADGNAPGRLISATCV